MMLIQVAPGQSLQTVIDALPADDQPVTIHLAPGVYEEKIALRRPRTCIEGESAETTRITWHDGAAEILPDGKKRGTFRTATLLINARDCALRNVTVENSAYPREQVGQALALYVDGDGFHCEDCTLKSCQDTLFTAPLPPEGRLHRPDAVPAAHPAKAGLPSLPHRGRCRLHLWRCGGVVRGLRHREHRRPARPRR